MDLFFIPLIQSLIFKVFCIYVSLSHSSCSMFLVLCLHVNSLKAGTKSFLLCYNQASDHPRWTQKHIWKKMFLGKVGWGVSFLAGLCRIMAHPVHEDEQVKSTVL